MHDRRMSGPDDSLDDIVLDPVVLVGVWANRTRVLRGRDAFTVDFLRDVPEQDRPVLVVRALVSPLVGVELRDQLDEAWSGYSEWSMPMEPEDA